MCLFLPVYNTNSYIILYYIHIYVWNENIFFLITFLDCILQESVGILSSKEWMLFFDKAVEDYTW